MYANKQLPIPFQRWKILKIEIVIIRSWLNADKNSLKIPKGYWEAIHWRRTNNIMVKIKGTKG